MEQDFEKMEQDRVASYQREVEKVRLASGLKDTYDFAKEPIGHPVVGPLPWFDDRSSLEGLLYPSHLGITGEEEEEEGV